MPTNTRNQRPPPRKGKAPPTLGVARVPAADLDLGTLKLQGKGTVGLAQAVTDATLEQRIDGASTLTLTAYDYSRALLRSNLMSGQVTLTFDNVDFTLVKVATSANALTLTFEETAANLLRQYSKAKKADRATNTRAQFIRSLITEVKEKRIPYTIPEVNAKQPVAPPAKTRMML
jgi:hypothetical protein